MKPDEESDSPANEPADKPAPGVQVGALCLGPDGRVLLVTSRDTHRWIIPKGWTMSGRSNAQAAMIEAWEEAGVKGRVGRVPIGQYHYGKRLGDGRTRRPITVQVFLAGVNKLAKTWPESHQRKRQWFAPSDAAELVAEPELQQLLLALPDPAEK